jgi:CRP-like cAMP-binding protein
MQGDLSLSMTMAGMGGDTATISLRDRVLLLGALNQSGALDEKTLTQVAEHVRPRSFLAGEFLLRDKEAIEHIYMLSRGQVTVTQQGRPVRVVSGNGAVGLTAVLAGVDSGVQALADEDTTTLALPADILMDLYESNFALVRNALRVLAGEVLDSRNMLPEDEGDDAALGVWRPEPRTFVEQIIEMRKSTFFEDTNLDAVLEVARQGREVRGSAGDVLWNAGDTSDYWLQLDYGRLLCTSEEGGTATVGSDYLLGPMDAMAARPRGYRVEALTDYIAFRMDRDVILAVFEGHFDLSRKILASLSEMVFQISSS